MAAADQDSGAASAAADAPSLRRQMSYTSSGERADQPMHDHTLSTHSFSTPAATLSSSPSPPMSGVSSFESIPVPAEELDRQSSSSASSTSSYGSFNRFEAAAAETATQAPAVQTMMSPQWSGASNESLFSIQLGQPGGVGDLYYDSDGNFHHTNPAGGDDGVLPAVVSEAPPSGCDDESKHSSVSPTLAGGQDEDEAPPETETKETAAAAEAKETAAATGAKETSAATEAKETGAPTEAWYIFRCCWPSAAPSV